MTTDLLAWLRAEMDAAEAEAEAAAAYNDGAEHDVQGPPGTWVLLADEAFFGSGHPGGAIGPRIGYANHVVLGQHIARHDPAATLRRIKAERKAVDLHVPMQGDAPGGGGTVCATCANVSREEVEGEPYPCTTVRLIAEGWGWTEETT